MASRLTVGQHRGWIPRSSSRKMAGGPDMVSKMDKKSKAVWAHRRAYFLLCFMAWSAALFMAHAQTANVATNAPACPFFSRYTNNQDGTVTNPRTGLMWKHCAEGASWDGSRCSSTGTPMNWVEAMKAAKASRYAGHSDWRLPTIAELESTKAVFCEGGMVEIVGNPKLEQLAFWSSSPWKHPTKPTADDVGAASAISFWMWSKGHNRFVSLSARLVRGSRPGDTSRQEFDTEYAKLNQYQKMVDEQRQKYQGSAIEH